MSRSNVVPLLNSGYRSANKTAQNALVVLVDLIVSGLEPIDVLLLAQQPMSNVASERQIKTFELIKAGF